MGHGRTTHGIGDRFSGYEREVHQGGMLRPIDGDVGCVVDALVGHEFKYVVLCHCIGNVFVSNFRQVDSGLDIAGGLRHIRRKDPGPAIDCHQSTTLSRGGRSSRDIGRSSGASLRALTALIATPARGHPLSVVGVFNRLPCKATARLNTEFSEVSFLFSVGTNAGWSVSAGGQECCEILATLHHMSATDGIFLVEAMQDCVRIEGW